MKQSESIVKLSMALVIAQSQMGGAVKDSKNPFFKSNYADLTSVIKAIKEPLSDNGLCYVQFPITIANGIGVTTRLIHESGEWLESEYSLPTMKNDPQSYGSAISYARRYSLQSLFGIPSVDNDGESAMIRGTVYISERQYDELSELIKDSGTVADKFNKAFGIDELSLLDVTYFNKARQMLKTKLSQKESAE